LSIVNIKLSNKDCKGITLNTLNTNISSDISKVNGFKASGNYKLHLRVQILKDGKKYQKKKTKSFSKVTTLNKAIDKMIALRTEISEDLKDGTIQEERATGINKDTPLTLNLLFDNHIKQKENTLAEKTINSYKGFYNTWIRDNVIGNTLIKDITKSQLQSIVNKILKKRAPRTAKTLKEVLNPIFRQQFFSGTITSNPIELLEFKKFDNTKNPELSEDEIKILYQAIRDYDYEDDVFKNIFIWLSHGRRVNEVLSLQWDDINIEDGTYTIKLESNKARKNMIYGLSDELLDTLSNRDKTAKYIFHSINDKNKKMHNDTIKRHWLKILEDAELENIRIHDLRHIVGLTLVNAGESLETIAAVLGHTTTSITKRYSKVRTETATKATSKFMEIINE